MHPDRRRDSELNVQRRAVISEQIGHKICRQVGLEMKQKLGENELDKRKTPSLWSMRDWRGLIWKIGVLECCWKRGKRLLLYHFNASYWRLKYSNNDEKALWCLELLLLFSDSLKYGTCTKWFLECCKTTPFTLNPPGVHSKAYWTRWISVPVIY